MRTDKDIGQRMQLLRKLIEYHRTMYHTFDAPELSDGAFDALKNELEGLEKKYPALVPKDSPTQKVGGKPLDAFRKVSHGVPMLSLSDAFSGNEMRAWEDRMKKYAGGPLQSGYFCELKIDGLAVELVYEKGKLVLGATRGDGRIGEDVTQNVETIGDIPRELVQLGAWPVPERCVLRGEIFISLGELEKINASREKTGEAKYANSRNLAAGSIRQLDPTIAASRNLRSFQYDLVVGVPAGIKTHEEKHKVLASWGCMVNPHTKAVRDLSGVLEFCDAWEKKRDTLAYEIDGVVVLVNDNDVFEGLGMVAKSQRGSIAYKFPPKEATTVVLDVIFQVGRTGVITPVASLRPVEVSGVKISHATLHNFDEIERQGLKIGDTVVITRSGDVIPKITRVIKELRTGKEKEVHIPRRCPVDHSPVERDGVFLRCSNPRCGARNRNQIIHFVSRDALNIQGLGKKIVDRFLDEGLISHAGDIFFLKEGDIAALDRFGEKSAHNLMEQIAGARKVELPKFIYALGIGHVGEETARALGARLPFKEGHIVSVSDVLRSIRSLSPSDLEEIRDVGPRVAESIYAWFRAQEQVEFIKALEKADLRIVIPRRGAQGVFAGLRIAITGTLSMSRQRAKELIEKEGGHFDSSVGQQTDILITGEHSGSKLQKARGQGISIWSEGDFLKRLGKG